MTCSCAEKGAQVLVVKLAISQQCALATMRTTSCEAVPPRLQVLGKTTVSILEKVKAILAL